MARPRSEDKRQTILAAAARLFSEAGLNVPTAQIARAAGVAQGTLFIYFASKDELINQLYLELKTQLSLAYVDLPGSSDLRESIWQFWSAYISWGLAHPVERRVLARLKVSEAVTNITRASAAANFCDVAALLMNARELGRMRNQPPAFVGELMVAMAEATIDFIESHPTATDTCADAFSAFWSAVTTG